MSSSILPNIQAQLNLYGYPTMMILGSIGNIFNIIIFSRNRQSACSIYLLTAALSNIFYSTFDGTVRMFSVTPGEGTTRSIFLCKLFSYISNTSGQIPKTMLTLACIDRFLITNKRASVRAFSTPKRAKYLIFFSIIFWSLMTVHLPIMTTVASELCGPIGIYSTIYTVYAIIFIGSLPPIISGVFGYLTYRNMRRRLVRVQPAEHDRNDPNIGIQRRDRDLLIIVISDVCVYVVTTVLFPATLLELMISGYVIPNKSFQYFLNELFTLNIALLLLFMNSATPFYTNLISSKSFRRDFKQLILKSYWKFRGKRPVQIFSTTNRTANQQNTQV